MVGVFAYKCHKIETITKFEEKHGESPTDDDLKPFHEFSNGAMQLAMYREEGNQVVATFLNEMLEIAVEKEVSERIIPELSKIVSSELKKNKQSFMFGVWQGFVASCLILFAGVCAYLSIFASSHGFQEAFILFSDFFSQK